MVTWRTDLVFATFGEIRMTPSVWAMHFDGSGKSAIFLISPHWNDGRMTPKNHWADDGKQAQGEIGDHLASLVAFDVGHQLCGRVGSYDFGHSATDFELRDRFDRVLDCPPARRCLAECEERVQVAPQVVEAFLADVPTAEEVLNVHGRNSVDGPAWKCRFQPFQRAPVVTQGSCPDVGPPFRQGRPAQPFLWPWLRRVVGVTWSGSIQRPGHGNAGQGGPSLLQLRQAGRRSGGYSGREPRRRRLRRRPQVRSFRPGRGRGS